METNWRETLKNAQIPVFNRSNLGIVLGNNRRMLDSRLASLVRQSILVPVKRGLYLNKYLYDTSSNKESILEYIGSTLVFPSYLSLEYILAKSGILAENVNALTYVTTKKTRKFQTVFGTYIYRSIKSTMFSDYDERVYGGLKYYVAKTYKALFDFIYFTPVKSAAELKNILLESRFNWDAFGSEDRERLEALIIDTKMPKMLKALSILKREKII